MLVRGYTVSQLKRAQVSWWYLFNAVTNESVRAMIHNAGSSSKAWRTLNEHFLPLSDSQINLFEHKLALLKMKQGEDPHIFFSQLKEILGVLLMLEVKKDDREICSIMLKGLTREYSSVRENMVIHFPRNKEMIEKHVRNKFLELSVDPKSAKPYAQALVAKGGKEGRRKKSLHPKSVKAPKDSSQRKCWICKEPGHIMRECRAHVVVHPSQARKESSEDTGGEFAASRALSVAVSKPVCEEWFGDTGAPFHLTGSLRHMTDLTPVRLSVEGIGGVACDVSLKGNVTVVFVTDEGEYVTQLKGVLFSPNLGYNLFSPNAEFDGETWEHLGGPDRVMTAFNGRVTFSNQDGMLMATAYRLGEDFNVALPALVPSAPPPYFAHRHQPISLHLWACQ